MFDKFVHAALGWQALTSFFLQPGAGFVEFRDFCLIGAHNGVVGGFDDAREKRVGLFVERCQFALCNSQGFLCLRLSRSPGRAHHSRDAGHKTTRGLHRFDKLFELPFDFRARDRLAIADAALGVAEIVRVFLVFAFGPAGRVGLITIPAENKATQGEVFANVLAHRSFGDGLTAFLDLFERLQSDQRLVLPFKPLQIVGV